MECERYATIHKKGNKAVNPSFASIKAPKEFFEKLSNVTRKV